MKITMLGVNSAFAKGEYADVVRISDLRDKLTKIKFSSLTNPQEAVEFTELVHDAMVEVVLNSLNVELSYFPKWQSNFLIEFDRPGKVKGDVYRLVLDFGGDIRHSLWRAGLTFNDIDGYYCSHVHVHNDHIGGTEGIALSTFFNPFYTDEKSIWLKGGKDYICDAIMDGQLPPAGAKPDLYCHVKVLEELWQASEPCLKTLQGARSVGLDTYFNVVRMYDNKDIQIEDGKVVWTIYPVISTHVMSGASMMASYGLMFEGSNNKKIYIPTDSMFMSPAQIVTFYKRADIVYQDCETGFRSGVHPYIDDLRNKLDPEIKKKCYLYHFDKEPEVSPGEFAGVLKTGEVHEY